MKVTYLSHTANWYQALSQSSWTLITSPVIVFLLCNALRKRFGVSQAQWGSLITVLVCFLPETSHDFNIPKYTELVGFKRGMSGAVESMGLGVRLVMFILSHTMYTLGPVS